MKAENKNKAMKNELAVIRQRLKEAGYSDNRRPPTTHPLFNEWQKVKAAGSRAARARKQKKARV